MPTDNPLPRVLHAAEEYAKILAANNHPVMARKVRKDIETVRRESRPLGSMNSTQSGR